MMKLLEFLANFALIGVGAWANFRCRDGTGSGNQVDPESDRAGVLLTLLLVYTILLYK
ncbi:MAG: hypothetical protein U0X92_04030 [Anaerolineales bacterium]